MNAIGTDYMGNLTRELPTVWPGFSRRHVPSLNMEYMMDSMGAYRVEFWRLVGGKTDVRIYQSNVSAGRLLWSNTYEEFAPGLFILDEADKALARAIARVEMDWESV